LFPGSGFLALDEAVFDGVVDVSLEGIEGIAIVLLFIAAVHLAFGGHLHILGSGWIIIRLKRRAARNATILSWILTSSS